MPNLQHDMTHTHTHITHTVRCEVPVQLASFVSSPASQLSLAQHVAQWHWAKSVWAQGGQGVGGAEVAIASPGFLN